MRFYQNDWVELIIEQLDKNKEVLLCCATKALRRDNTGEIYACNNPNSFGATINLKKNKMMLDSEWIKFDIAPESFITEIPCVLRAGYATTKYYWQHLRGLEGLVHYGSDETYISLKVWLAGGKCLFLKNIKIGHIYRDETPYTIENSDNIFNKLLISELLLPFQYKTRLWGHYAALALFVLKKHYHL